MFADNYATQAVPEDQQVSGFRIGQIYVGVAITLPAFLVAAEVVSALGFARGVLALALSGLTLFVLAAATMTVAAHSRASTYAIVQAVFGRWPARGINLLLALTMLGWFAVTISLFAGALDGASRDLLGVSAPLWMLTLGGGAVMILLTLYGFKAIDALARAAVPLLALVLIAAFTAIVRDHDFGQLMSARHSGALSLGAGVSIFVGAFMAGVTIAPDIARFAKSIPSAVFASLLGFGLGYPLVMLFAGVPALATGETDFVANLAGIGFGWPALFVVVFATITTNINNLYAVSLSLRQVFPAMRDHQVTAAAGTVGTALALLGFENAFIPFLIFLGVAIPPIAGVYVVEFLLRRRIRPSAEAAPLYWRALAAWGTGSAVAFATSQAWLALTSSPAIDALLVSGAVYFLLSRITARVAVAQGDG